jgi:hypothetical protein
MRIYLDTSVYNRPFDDQVQPRIWLETSSLVVILQMVQAGEIQLVGSSVLTYENSQNPFLERRQLYLSPKTGPRVKVEKFIDFYPTHGG